MINMKKYTEGPKQQGALENLLVLDLTRVVAGPFTGSILGDMGATVIKIEMPEKGDDSRAYGPYKNGESVYFANLNRSKKGITLNLKSDEGKKIFLELVKKADILLENYRPGVMDRLGLGYDVLRQHNEGLIYAATSGFGSYGRYHERPGYDILAQAMGGLMSITGPKDSDPTRAGNAMGDILAGLNTAIGVLAAVNARSITGKGQRVDVALVDSVVSSLENTYIRYISSGKLYERNGNAYAAIAPYNSYHAKDGFVIIACGNDKLFEKFCNDIIHHPEWITDERFINNANRVKNELELKALIEEWTKQHTVKEITDMLLTAGIPAGPIYDAGQILTDDHIVEDREMFVEVDHPIIGKMVANGNPIKLMDTMPHITCPAPTLGQHNKEIYCGLLGMEDEQFNSLKAAKVI